MPDVTQEEVAVDNLFSSQGGQILCEGVWDRTNEYNEPDTQDGRWVTTTTGMTFYDADNGALGRGRTSRGSGRPPVRHGNRPMGTQRSGRTALSI